MAGKKVAGCKMEKKRKSTERESEEVVDQSAQKRLALSSIDVPKSLVIHKQRGSNATGGDRENMSTTANTSCVKLKRPPSPFILYYNDHCKMDLDNEGKKKKWTCSAKIELGEIWKKLSKEEKDKYTARNEALKEEYEKAKMVEGNYMSSMKKKEKFDTRCYPSRFREMLDTLGAAYNASIRSIGFGGLLSLRRHKLKRPLCRWLVDIFDCDSSSFTLGGRKVSVSPDYVARVLGLTSSGVRISFDGDDKYARKLCERFNLPIGAPIKLLDLEGQLKKAGPDSDEFKAKFVMYTLGRLLCPGSDVTTDRKYVLCLNEDALGGRVNWAQHVYDALIDGIQSYQQAMDRKYVSGCVLVLQVLFLDHVARSGQRDVSRFSILPRIGAWGEVEIQKIMRRNRGFEKLNDRKGQGMAQPLRSTTVEEHAGGMQFTSLLQGVDHRLQKVKQEVKGGKGRYVAEEEVAKQRELRVEVASLRTEVHALQEDVRAMFSHLGQKKGRPQPLSDAGTEHLSFVILKDINNSPVPPSFPPKCNMVEARNSIEEDDELTITELLESNKKHGSVENGQAGDGENLSGQSQTLSSSIADSEAAKNMQPWTGLLDKDVHVEAAMGGSNTDIEDAKESNPGSLVQNGGSTNRSEGDGSCYSFEIPGMELEGRIRKLERLIAELKAARYGKKWSAHPLASE